MFDTLNKSNGGSKNNMFMMDQLNTKPATFMDAGIATCMLSALGNSYGFFSHYQYIGITALGIGIVSWEFIEKIIGSKNRFWKTLFTNLDIVTKDEKIPLLQETRKTDYGTLYRFNCPIGLGLSDFKTEKERIQSALGKEVELKYSNKNILIEVLENPLKDKYPFELTKTPSDKDSIVIHVGYTFGSKPVYLTITDDNAPHLLIAGSTGKGKSNTVNVIITNLTTIFKDICDIYAIDMKKGVELNDYKQCENVIGFAENVNQVLRLLENIYKEMEDRYTLFKKVGCKNIKSYNKKNKNNRLKYKIVIFDEFATLYLDKCEEAQRCVEIMESLSALARACGIHLILVTQRPDKDIINGKIKANVTQKIGLTCSDRVNSSVVGIEGLEKLQGKGHCILVNHNNEEIEGRIMLIEEDDITKTLKAYRKPITNVPCESINTKSIRIENQDQLNELLGKKKPKEDKKKKVNFDKFNKGVKL